MTGRRLILWDFDGTLADTLGLALHTYNCLAADNGFRLIDDPQSVRDQTMKQFLKSHQVPAWRVPGLFRHFLKSMQAATRTVRLFPGIVDVVRNLQLAGFEHGIVSSNSTENIRLCLQHNSADTLFADVCGTSKLFGKEHRIRKALKQFGTSPEYCLYVGDEVRDIEAAEASHVSVGCVAWGLNSVEVLNRHAPAFLAAETSDLLPLICAHFAVPEPARAD